MIRAVTLLVAALGSASPATAQLFARPTLCSGCIGNWFYFDHQPGVGAQDWSCLRRTYSGHRGTDFSLAGGNPAIDEGHDLVAMADGVVVAALDGFFDRCTRCGGEGCGVDFGSGYGNHLFIDHGDYTVIYAHMRTGSVRFGVGDHVACGDVVGQMGSSGCSTGAHVHVEFRPRGGEPWTALDPFEGECSDTPASLWVEQGFHMRLPGGICERVDAPAPRCAGSGDERWSCVDLRTRRRCIDGRDEEQACPEICRPGEGDGDARCAPSVEDGGPPSVDGGGPGDAPDAGHDIGDAAPAIDARPPPPHDATASFLATGGGGCSVHARGDGLAWALLLWLATRRRDSFSIHRGGALAALTGFFPDRRRKA